VIFTITDIFLDDALISPVYEMGDPWEIARTRYLERLDADEAVLFNKATIENLFYSTSNTNRDDRAKSKTRNAIATIQPLVDKIEEYGKAMDVLSNIATTFVAPIWGSLRVVLVLASDFGRFYERMTDTLGRIGDILPRLLVSLSVPMRQGFGLDCSNRIIGLSTNILTPKTPSIDGIACKRIPGYH
jgi:hypothetical protein